MKSKHCVVYSHPAAQRPKDQNQINTQAMQKLAITASVNKPPFRHSGNESTMDVATLQAQLQEIKEKVKTLVCVFMIWSHDLMLCLDAVSCVLGQTEKLCLPLWSRHMPAVRRQGHWVPNL